MRHLFSLLLLVFLLPGCRLLQQAKEINQKHYAEVELKRITEALQAQEPTFQIPATLYLIDDSGKYREELEKLHSIISVSHPLSTKIALIMGDGEGLLGRTSDTILLSNAHLLMGNVFEAERLMRLSSRRDAATEAMIHLRQGREDEASVLLEWVIEYEENTNLRLRAARVLSLLGKGGWDYLSRYSPSEWERYMADAQLSRNHTPTTPREIAYSKYISALESPDSLPIKEAAQLLLSEPRAPWRQYALGNLLPYVVEQKHWVELYKIAQESPELAVAQPICYQILQFEKEVELMARYETPEQSSMNIVPTIPREGSFRSVWGNVSNSDNWAMERYSLQSVGTPSARPTAEQYELARRLISRFIKPKLNIEV